MQAQYNLVLLLYVIVVHDAGLGFFFVVDGFYACSVVSGPCDFLPVVPASWCIMTLVGTLSVFFRTSWKGRLLPFCVRCSLLFSVYSRSLYASFSVPSRVFGEQKSDLLMGSCQFSFFAAAGLLEMSFQFASKFLAFSGRLSFFLLVWGIRLPVYAADSW